MYPQPFIHLFPLWSMRWLIVLLLILAACEIQTAETSGASIIYTCYGERCHETGNGQVFEKDKMPTEREPEVLPNYTETRSENNPLSCQALGCESNMQLVGDPKSRLFYTCDCPAARDIPFKRLACLRSFDFAHEEGYVRAPASVDSILK